MFQANKNVNVVKDVNTSSFITEVIEGSKSIPVLVDFWAPWCGPCKQLTPILEKVASTFSGRLKLVKMNTEKHPEIPAQMRIQSIPAVVAFVDGKPVDAFVGLKTESEIKTFFEKHAGSSRNSGIDDTMATARKLIAENDLSSAMNLLASLLQSNPENSAPMALMGMIYLKNGDIERAENIFSSIDKKDHEQADVATLKVSVELAREASELGDIEQLTRACEENPDNLQAKFDLSLISNMQGNQERAVDMLLEIMRKDRTWSEDRARIQLLKYFNAWGENNRAAQYGRRKLSSILFS